VLRTAHALLLAGGGVAALGGLGCKPPAPDGTTPPATAVPASDASASRGGAPEACGPELANDATVLFDERVSITPPVGIGLLQQEPFEAGTSGSAGHSTACGKRLEYMKLFMYQHQEGKSLGSYADEFVQGLARGGFTSGDRSAARIDDAKRLDFSVHYPGTSGAPAVAFYISVQHLSHEPKQLDNVLVVVFVTAPDQLDALLPTFDASADSLAPAAAP
jgi:hypothetical protein